METSILYKTAAWMAALECFNHVCEDHQLFQKKYIFANALVCRLVLILSGADTEYFPKN